MKGGTRALVAAGAGIVVVLGAVALAAALGSGGDDEDRIGLGSPENGVVAVPGFVPRFAPAVTTVDSSLFVFGGYPPQRATGFNDGVLVTPDLTSATRLPDGPFDPPLYSPQAAGVDGRVLVVGTACANQRPPDDSAAPICDPGTFAAAVLDPRDERNEWRRVDVPEPVRDRTPGGGFVDLLGATADGRAVVGFGLRHADGFWTFDPDTDAWQPIDGSGVRPEDACLAGDRLVVLTTGFLHHGTEVGDDPARHTGPGGSLTYNLGDGFVETRLVSRDLARDGSWASSSSLPRVGTGQQVPELLCLGDSAALMDPPFIESLRVFSFARGQWTTPAPAPRSDYSRDKVWNGDELVFLPTEADDAVPGIAYAPATNRWRTVAGFPAVTRRARWNGSAIVGYSEPLPIGDVDGKAVTALPGVFRVEP